MDYKKRVANAIEKYNRKQCKEKKPRATRNKAPEKEVVKICLGWLRSSGFDVHVVEAKAVFSAKAGRYLSSQTTPGMSDIVGNSPEGVACFIEVKAKGKISTLRENQRQFLINKIHSNCFAVVVDSQDTLQSCYSKWQACRQLNAQHAKEYLLGLLPNQKPGIELELDSVEDLPF